MHLPCLCSVMTRGQRGHLRALERVRRWAAATHPRQGGGAPTAANPMQFVLFSRLESRDALRNAVK